MILIALNSPSHLLSRALEVWGSWQVLEHELERRRREEEEEERRRKGEGLCLGQSVLDFVLVKVRDFVLVKVYLYTQLWAFFT